MKLLSATPSPYARKARIALHEKGLPFELVTEVPWNGDASAPRFNPLGKVPVLMLDDGECVYESRLIVEYLELKHPWPPLFPKDADALIAAKRLEVLADGACDAVVLMFIERQREADKQSPAWLQRQAGKIAAAVDEIARRVAPGTEFAVGDSFGLGDIAVGCVLGYLDLRYPELDWRRHEHLQALFDRLSQRTSFRETVPVAQTISTKVA
jgi:glutathione S-transferase